MATATLVAAHPVPDPSDADLLQTLASLLDAMPGPTVGPRLSRLVRFVADIYCAGTADPDVRADRLCRALADYLHGWHVLRVEQMTAAGLDEWAGHTSLVFLRAALLGCARQLRAQGGEVRWTPRS